MNTIFNSKLLQNRPFVLATASLAIAGILAPTAVLAKPFENNLMGILLPAVSEVNGSTVVSYTIEEGSTVGKGGAIIPFKVPQGASYYRVITLDEDGDIVDGGRSPVGGGMGIVRKSARSQFWDRPIIWPVAAAAPSRTAEERLVEARIKEAAATAPKSENDREIQKYVQGFTIKTDNQDALKKAGAAFSRSTFSTFEGAGDHHGIVQRPQPGDYGVGLKEGKVQIKITIIIIIGKKAVPPPAAAVSGRNSFVDEGTGAIDVVTQRRAETEGIMAYIPGTETLDDTGIEAKTMAMAGSSCSNCKSIAAALRPLVRAAVRWGGLKVTVAINALCAYFGIPSGWASAIMSVLVNRSISWINSSNYPNSICRWLGRCP